ncbi:MAG: PepSY domain-containing protein [Burkholderiales bacterium]|nr:PepSY domain-containing protein [Burkholderiales bacterium]
MRPLLTRLHRWAGLFLALFLTVAGLTGAVIAWEQPLDRWLNPTLFLAPEAADRPVLAPLELARRLEAAEPHLQVIELPLAPVPGRTLVVTVAPRVDAATGVPPVLGFDQVMLDPATGAVRGSRDSFASTLSRETLLPFIYQLHYSLHLPDVGRLRTGLWVLGLVSMVWILDCAVALAIAFPHRRSWRKSFAFRIGQGWPKLSFDLHRSGGAWTWVLLLVMAVTSVSMNLGNQVVQPVVSWFSPLTPTVFERRAAVRVAAAPRMTREQAVARARQEAARRGWTLPPGSLLEVTELGLYGIAFFPPGNDARGQGGLGHLWIYLDAGSGDVVDEDVPGTGSAGDVFMQAQFPLHSGRIAGTAGRVAVSLLGLGVAVLSLTGIVLWIRRRRARVRTGSIRGF